MKRVLLLAGLAVSASIGLSAPSLASPVTDAFVANIRPNVDFLDRSSRLALDRSTSPAVRAFAHGEAMEQTVAANSLVAWTQTHTVGGMVVALSAPQPGVVVVSSVSEVPVAPLVTADEMADGVNTLVTGRSVAVERAPQAAPALLPAGDADLSRLRELRGRRFDALYRATQLDSLRQLATLYRDYATSGDDPALRALAVRELPRVNDRIVALRRL